MMTMVARGLRLPFAIALAVGGYIAVWSHMTGVERQVFLWIALPFAIATAWIESTAFAAAINECARLNGLEGQLPVLTIKRKFDESDSQRPI